MAKEMMSYTKNSMLVQSAQVMRAQANQLPQTIFSCWTNFGAQGELYYTHNSGRIEKWVTPVKAVYLEAIKY